jgi:hypothetical protein
MTHIKNKIGRSETIEVSILNNNSREFKFSDNESTLQDVIVEGIFIHTADLLVSKNNRAMLPDVNLKSALLTLSTNKQKLVVKELPLQTFFKNDNGVTWLKPFKIDIAKSLVTIPNSVGLVIPPGPPSGYAIMITLFYRKYDAVKDRLDEDGCVIE